MIRKNFYSALIAASLLLPSACLLAQNAPAEHPHHELPKPTNLQVLPKDIAPADLIAIMRGFTGSLGVHCSFCHEQNAQTHEMNFASDAKPEKTSARIMMRMTHEINTKYLAELPDHDEMKVGCGTCHRGHSMPEPFTPAPEEHHAPPASGK